MIDIRRKQEKANAQVNRALTHFADARSQGRRFHAETLGKDVDPEYSFGDFLLLVLDRNDGKLEKRYGSTRLVNKTALAESSGTTGGYTVPRSLSDDLMEAVADAAIFRPRAAIEPMDGAELSIPYWDVTTATSNGVPPFWGGLDFSFEDEGSAGVPLAESEPKWRQLVLKPSVIGGFLLASMPFMQDATGAEKWLRRAFAKTLAWLEDWYFINGTGVGQPLGLLNSGAAKTQSRQTTNSFTNQDSQNMFGDLYVNDTVDASVWLMSYTVRGQRVSQTNWFVNGPMQMYGLEIIDTFKQPPLGTTGDVIAVDCSMYVIGDREQLTIDSSKYAGTAFQNNQMYWRIAERIDGAPLLSNVISVPDGAGTPNTVSPIVILKH